MNAPPPNPKSFSLAQHPVESWHPTNRGLAFPCPAPRTTPRFRNSVISHSGPHVRPETHVASWEGRAAEAASNRARDSMVEWDQHDGCPLSKSKGAPVRRGHGQPQRSQPRRLTRQGVRRKLPALVAPASCHGCGRRAGQTPGRWLLPSFWKGKGETFGGGSVMRGRANQTGGNCSLRRPSPVPILRSSGLIMATRMAKNDGGWIAVGRDG